MFPVDEHVNLWLALTAVLTCAACLVYVKWGRAWLFQLGLHMVRYGRQELAGAPIRTAAGRKAVLSLEQEERRAARLVKIAEIATAYDCGAWNVIARRNGIVALFSSVDEQEVAQRIADLKNEDAADHGSGWIYTVQRHPKPGKSWRPEMANYDFPEYRREHSS